MKWLRLANGRPAHAVSARNEAETLCGLPTAGGMFLVCIDDEDRCRNCDDRWRWEGRQGQPRRTRAARAVEYRPRCTFEDWEKLDGHCARRRVTALGLGMQARREAAMESRELE